MEKGANGTEIVDAKLKQTLEESRYLDYADDGLAESYGPHVVVRAYYPEGTDPENSLPISANAWMSYPGKWTQGLQSSDGRCGMIPNGRIIGRLLQTLPVH